MKYLVLFFFFVFSWSLQAQIDSEENSVPIPVVEVEDDNHKATEVNKTDNESKPIENNGLVIPKENKINGMSVPKTNQPLHVPEKEFSMLGNRETFGNPGELYEKKIKKHARYTELEKREKSYTGSLTDQFFGDFKTKSGSVNILYRDYGAFDGDHIRIYVNEDVIKGSALLSPGYRGFKFKLAEGINKIDFLALDTGQVSPNTAEFQILDDDGNVISGSQWSLAKGVKATIIITKE